MTATVRFTITKPHDVTLRVRAVDDGSVQHEQLFAAGACECMSDEFVVHAGVMLEVFEGEPRQTTGDLRQEIANRDSSLRELEHQAARNRIANAEEEAAYEALQERLNTAKVRLAELESSNAAAQTRIAELESSNSAAQARALKQRGK